MEVKGAMCFKEENETVWKWLRKQEGNISSIKALRHVSCERTWKQPGRSKS